MSIMDYDISNDPWMARYTGTGGVYGKSYSKWKFYNNDDGLLTCDGSVFRAECQAGGSMRLRMIYR